MRPRLILSGFQVVAAMVVAAALLSATGAAPGLPPQSSSSGGVTVEAIPRVTTGPEWRFEIVFNTHTRELRDDLMNAALLITDGRETRPSAWQGDPPGGHHRKGTLTFAAPARPPSAMELRIQSLGEPSPRTFRWQLQ